MSSIQELPDDSLYLASVDRLRDFASGVCLAETVTELTIGSGEKKTRAALVSVDFSTNLPALAALGRLPEPSLGGSVRWSWLHNLGAGGDDGTLWRFDVTTDGDEPVTFAVIGGITPEIRALLESVERILISAEEPTAGVHPLDAVLAEIPSDGFNDPLN